MEMYFILLVQMRNFRWLDTVGSIAPKIEHKLRPHKQRFGKIATTEDQICYHQGSKDIGVVIVTE